ncbi:MAG: GYD domain-containing protein [Candidatus Omnitrophica bacterium]|nr:GYD domain-containing protein [Candidatus Omnitrophota bacterium]
MMETFIFLGKYSPEAVRDISSDRTSNTITLIKEIGGEVVSMYALLGGYDLVLIVKLPSATTAMKASLALTMLTGISFQTHPALAVDDLDRIIGEARE